MRGNWRMTKEPVPFAPCPDCDKDGCCILKPRFQSEVQHPALVLVTHDIHSLTLLQTLSSDMHLKICYFSEFKCLKTIMIS